MLGLIIALSVVAIIVIAIVVSGADPFGHMM
jgi:hypothetical protein